MAPCWRTDSDNSESCGSVMTFWSSQREGPFPYINCISQYKPHWTSPISQLKAFLQFCIGLLDNLLFFSLVLHSSPRCYIYHLGASFLPVSLLLSLSSRPGSQAMSYLVYQLLVFFPQFIPSYLDHWISWWAIIFFFLSHLKRHYFKEPLLFQVKIFMIAFFLPRRDLAPILALPWVYVCIGQNIQLSVLVSKMIISIPYFIDGVVEK